MPFADPDGMVSQVRGRWPAGSRAEWVVSSVR